MPPKARKSYVRAGTRFLRSSATLKPPNAELLNEDELLFLWKGLVENGQLSISKLQMFMREVAGVNMSVVQAKDLLNYMDANGDGRVGMEDFKNFLSIGHLSETDAKAFMWEPKKKFMEENPYSAAKLAAAHEPAPAAAHHGHHHDNHSGHDHEHHHENVPRRTSFPQEEAAPSRASSKPLAPPEVKAPAKRRNGLHHMRSSLAHGAPEQPQREPSSHNAAPKKPRPPPLTAETEKKIEKALLKYEEQCWERFMVQEKQFKRQLFEQFAGTGGDELEVTEYHKMLMKWIPLASWCAPRGLRPADSLAALEYVLRRDLEERGLAAKPPARDAGAPPPTLQGAAPENAPDPPAPAEARMSYALWLDVLNGKHRPEEHICDLRSAHGPQASH